MEKVQRRILRAIFFKEYTESSAIVLTKYKILSASELYISELIREVFLQLGENSPLNFLTHARMKEIS